MAQDLEAELKAAKADIQALASMAAERANELGHAGSAIASQHIDSLSAEARRVFDEAVNEGTRYRAKAESQIKENPLAAAGIFFLLGAVTAAIFGRR